MALTRLIVAALLAPAIALGQPVDAGVDAPAQTLEPPRAIGETTVPYPAGAPAHTDPIVVTVKMLVDETGAITTVELVTAANPPFDAAVIAAVKTFKFEPGKFGGAPVPVEITFTHTFQPPPPPPPPAETGPAKVSVLRGKLVQLGTRAPVTGATVTAEIDGRHYTADADQRGRFELPIPAGAAKITVTAPGHNRFLQQERLASKQSLAVTYYVERDRYDPYEIVVVGDQRREEVSRVSLTGREIHQIPGTFGDPYRVIQTLPGVASVVSLLPFPIVRGASPSSTGFLLDGTRVPLLFHLLSGPSVIHGEFIEEVEFYPGGAPAPYGGYTAGIVDGRTRRARSDEHLLDFDANLLQLGGLVRQPILGATATVAGRYGYPGLIMSLATKEVALSYWDYQVRLDGGTPKRGWTVFAYGARDQLDTAPATEVDPEMMSEPPEPPPLEPTLILGFHRLDLRYHRTFGRALATVRGVVGYDRTFSQGTDFSMLVAEPSVGLKWKYDDTFTLSGGLEGSAHDIRQGSDSVEAANAIAAITGELDRFYNGAAFVEALVRPAPRWLLRPGVRASVFADGETTKAAVDPRFTVRYELARRELADIPPDSDDSAVWLKASAGIYHQPPRFVLPLPGLDQMPLRFGLLRSYQTSAGIEVPLQNRIQITAEAFFNYMDPTIFDLSVNDASIVTGANETLIPTETVIRDEGQELIDRLTAPQLGRAYGGELLLRRQSKSGLFGWISYTLSRSERMRDGQWVAYDFDRSHLLNLVAGLPLPRNWDLGLRLGYQSGKPLTTTSGYNTARTAGYVRFDLRVDKRVVWRDWLLDFYVDVTNVALLPEEVNSGTVIRYVLPTLGVRGRF